MKKHDWQFLCVTLDNVTMYNCSKCGTVVKPKWGFFLRKRGCRG